jgi:orotate phosphoribosyltransferase
MINKKSSFVHDPEARNAAELLAPHTKRGEFTLRSGRKSDLYVDVRSAVLAGGMTPTGLVAAMQTKAESHFETQGESTRVFHVVGYGYGGALLVQAHSMLFRGAHSIIRGEKKAHGLGQAPMGDEIHRGSRVVLFEDVWTTGSSVVEAVHRVRELGAEVDLVVALVNRSATGGEAVDGGFAGFPPVVYVTNEDALRKAKGG